MKVVFDRPASQGELRVTARKVNAHLILAVTGRDAWLFSGPEVLPGDSDQATHGSLPTLDPTCPPSPGYMQSLAEACERQLSSALGPYLKEKEKKAAAVALKVHGVGRLYVCDCQSGVDNTNNTTPMKGMV